MTHQLFAEIDKFKKWALAYSDIPEDLRGGEWEDEYENKGRYSIYEQFGDFLQTLDPLDWTDEVIEKLLYIIARDNEFENLANQVGQCQAALFILASKAIVIGSKDSRWQLADQLTNLKDEELAEKLLESYTHDKEEYVRRRALMSLAQIGSSRIENYCKTVWEIPDEQQEYSRMVVLDTLNEINSPLLVEYLNKAKQDKREYLLKRATEIEQQNSR